MKCSSVSSTILHVSFASFNFSTIRDKTPLVILTNTSSSNIPFSGSGLKVDSFVWGLEATKCWSNVSWNKHVPFSTTPKRHSCAFTLSVYELVIVLPVNIFNLIKALASFFNSVALSVDMFRGWYCTILFLNKETALLISSIVSQ